MTATVSPSVDTRTGGTDWYEKGGILGLVFTVLLGVGVFMTMGAPDAKSAAKDQSWAIKHTGLLGLSAFLVVLAVVVGLYWLIWLRSQLDRPSSWVGNVYMMGAGIFALSGTVSAGIHLAESTDAKHLSQSSLQLMASLDQNFTYPMTSAGLALMYLGVGILIRRSGVLPGWLAWVSFVFALLGATLFFGFFTLMGTVLFIPIVSIMLLMHPQPAES